MSPKPTHRLVRRPKVTGSYLADYMAGSERARRRIVRDCKFRPIARIIQHDRAKLAVSRFLLEGASECDLLTQEAARLRSMMADSPFDRDVLDNNADYVDAFAAAFPNLEMPDASRLPFSQDWRAAICGVEVNPGVQFALQRVTRTNKTKTGLVAFRYAKGRALAEDAALWQSALLFGCRRAFDQEEEAEPEQRLCLTLDAFSGTAHAAPGDAVSRYLNIEAACQSIAERWDSVEPPEGAVIS